MDPVLALKRPSRIDLNACVFCQQHLRDANDYSRTVVCEAMNLRIKCKRREEDGNQWKLKSKNF